MGLLNSLASCLTAAVVVLSCLMSPSARAQGQPVSLTAQFQFEPGTSPFLGSRLSIDFTAPPAGDNGYVLQPGSVLSVGGITGTLLIDGLPRASSIDGVAWFSGGASTHGVDIRLSHVFEPGDWLQVVLRTPRALFSVPPDGPTLEIGTFGGTGRLRGFLGYSNVDDDYQSADLYAGIYRAGVVPEPGTAVLGALGAATLAAVWAVRRSRVRGNVTA